MQLTNMDDHENKDVTKFHETNAEQSLNELDGIGGNKNANNDVDSDNDSNSHTMNDHGNQSEKVISSKETKDVIRLKLFVCLILLTSAFTIASIVYVYITRNESSTFESNFNDDASKVLEAIGSSLDRTLGVLDSVNILLVSHAMQMRDKWPFVTLPNFGEKMAKLFPLTDILKISIAPVVYPKQRLEWEQYSLNMDSWVNKSIRLQETWEGFYGPINYNWTAHGTIHGDDGDIESNVR